MTNRHARARTWTPRLRSHGWQWCLGPQLKEDNPLEVGQHSTQPILTSAKPFWRQGPKIELCRTPNPNVAMGAKRACPFEEELRDLLTYTCPYSGNKRCPPLYKENIKFHILLQWWYVFVWCIFPISAIWVVCGFCLRKIIFMHAWTTTYLRTGHLSDNRCSVSFVSTSPALASCASTADTWHV